MEKTTATGTGRTLKIGLNLPIGERMLGGQTASWTDLLAYARRAEALGFDSLWLADHLLLEWQGHTNGTWECWSLLAALAAATERVELGSLVSCAIFRNPALLAKMADTVDEISGGRLILGLGAGWDGPEYRAFGYPADHRVARFEEALRIIAPLLRTGRVDFAGQYYAARDCELRPRGPRPAGPPIMIGAKGPRMLRLAADHADLWNAEGPLRHPDDYVERRASADDACAAIGRDPATLGRTAAVVIDLAGDSAEQSPGRVAALLDGYARAGLAHVQVWLTPNTIESVERFADSLGRRDGGAGQGA